MLRLDAFLEAVLETAATRIKDIPAGSMFRRAQLGHDWKIFGEPFAVYLEDPRPLHPDRMKPRPGFAREGRTNPKGIPCLYLADNRETVIAEVRPWLGAYVSVGEFRVKRDIRIVDCTTPDSVGAGAYIDEPPLEIRELRVWQRIDQEFSRPVVASDEEASYVPTQIIAELFRVHGYDGIGYRSSLGPGHNIAFFNLATADLVSCFVYKVDEITYQSSQAGEPYSSQIE